MITTDYIPDCIFTADNNMEIPTLRLDRQAEVCEAPFVCFGEQRRTYEMEGRGILHFYTDDYRFGAIFQHPEKILQYDPGSIIEPNYSLFFETPIAFGMQYIYKKRFIARALQEKGVKVLVDLNVSPKYYELNMLGVPQGWHAFATKGCPYRMEQTDFEYEMALRRFGGAPEDLLFVVYGGGEECQEWCANHQAVYITPMARYKEKKKLREKLESSIAFYGKEIEPKTLASQDIKPLINDYRNGK